jgi:ketosteroid isomerase-like protein
MQLTDILKQSGGLQSIARELGIGEDDAATAASALSPAVLGGFRKQVEAHPQGMAGFGNLLNQLGGSSLLDQVVSSTPTNTAPGNNILGQIFGSKDVSNAVVQNASAQTGHDPSMLRKMLPMLAMVAVGYMAKQHSAAQASRQPAIGRSGGRRRGRTAERRGAAQSARRDHARHGSPGLVAPGGPQRRTAALVSLAPTAFPRLRRHPRTAVRASVRLMNTLKEHTERSGSEGSLSAQRILRMTPDGKTASSIEAILRKRIDELTQAIRDKDVDRLMTFYAADVVAFDVRPPLETLGAGAYRENFEHWFASFDGPLSFELKDLRVVPGEPAAFCHFLALIVGARPGGRKSGYGVRGTTCFERREGEWLVTHEHISMPASM